MALTLQSAALATLLVTASSSSHPITPRSIEYSYSAEESREGKVCAIVTSLTNAKPPQNVTFTIFAGYSRQAKAIGVGFLITAAQQSPSGKVEYLDLSSASVESENFSSEDEMDNIVSDGGTLMVATPDGEIGTAFSSPCWQTICFSLSQASKLRTRTGVTHLRRSAEQCPNPLHSVSHRHWTEQRVAPSGAKLNSEPQPSVPADPLVAEGPLIAQKRSRPTYCLKGEQILAKSCWRPPPARGASFAQAGFETGA